MVAMCGDSLLNPITNKKLCDPRNIVSLVELFDTTASYMGKQPFMWRKVQDEWRAISWAHSQTLIERMANALRMMGVESGARVLLLSENRPEWVIANLAIMTVGAISVPLYTTQTPGSYAKLIKDSGAFHAFCSTPALYNKLHEAIQDLQKSNAIKEFQAVVMIDALEDQQHQASTLPIYEWEDCLQTGKMQNQSLKQMIASHTRNQTCSIIYSSGTSGTPNGIMLSHGSILCNVWGAMRMLDDLPGCRWGKEVFLSFLPLSHSYEHVAGQFIPISMGGEIYFCDNLDHLIKNISEVRPTIMTAVPRFYETLRAKILGGLQSQSKFRQKLFNLALVLGKKRLEKQHRNLGEKILDSLLERIVRKKVRERFGGRLKAFISGGGPLNYENGMFLSALGLRLLQGYGLTEASPVVSVNNPLNNQLDTVGAALEGVEVQCGPDNELMVRGELLMQGYWNQPELTAKTIVDGWLMTGDIGNIDADGLIRITDRKKDIFINSGGENIAPQKIEGILCLETEISNAMVYGDGKAYLTALIVEEEGASENDIAQAVKNANARLTISEKVKKFILADEPFSIANEEMTPSLKIRRHVICNRYQKTLEKLYTKK